MADHTVKFPSSLDRVVVGPHGQVTVQTEQAIFSLATDTGKTRPLLGDREGSELVCAWPGDRLTLIDTAGRLVLRESSGKILHTVALGADAEFAASRPLPGGDAVLILIAEMLGDSLGLGEPRYRFAIANETLDGLIWIAHEWSTWPEQWAVDSFQDKLLVSNAAERGVFDAYALKSGQEAGRADWPSAIPARDVLTGLAISPTDGRAVLATWSERRQYAKLVLAQPNESGSSNLVSLPPDLERIQQPSWSPDGARILFACGPETASVAMVIDAQPKAAPSIPRVLCPVELDGQMLWCGPRRALVVTGEQDLQILDLE